MDNNNILYLISFITGLLCKIGDDMLDIYNYKHGNFYAEFLKALLTICFTILITKSDNIWIYYTILCIWGGWIVAPHQYLQDSYAKTMTIIFCIVPIIYILIDFNIYKLYSLSAVYSLLITTFLYSIIAFPFYIQDSLFFYNFYNSFHFKNKEWIYEEVGINKLILRSIGLIITLIMLYIVNNYNITTFLTETKFKSGYICGCLIGIGYYLISIINQIYNLYFNKNYTSYDEKNNKIRHKKDIKKYKKDIKKIQKIFSK